MKTLATSILFLGLCLMINAQAPLVKQWDKRFGGTNYEKVTSFRQTTNAGFILGGPTLSGIGADKTQDGWGSWDYWVVKIDSLGNKQWDRRFGGIKSEELRALQQTADGGYMLGGYSESGISGDKTQPNWDTLNLSNDFWIIKIDSGGNTQWDKRYGGTGNEIVNSLQQTNDGGYILGGFSGSVISGDKTENVWDTVNYGFDYWIVKIDSMGVKQWDKHFGGIDRDELNSLQQTIDGGYILGGYSYSGISGDKTQPNWDTTHTTSDYWIIKVDSVGTKQWDKRFGGNLRDVCLWVEQTHDRGYVLGGLSYSDSTGDKAEPMLDTSPNINKRVDFWIVKVDSVGNKQWAKKFGGLDGEDEFGNISQLSDGGYLIGGASYSAPSGEKSENNLGMEQSWIIKADSLGNKIWDKTIFTPGHDENGFVVQTQDGCYAIANYTNGDTTGGYNTQLNRGEWDFWIVKLCDTSHCSLSPSTVIASQTAFCSGDSAQVCAPSGFSNYLWNTGESTACIKAQLAGNYYVTVTDFSGCTAESNHLAITVLPLPPVAISVNGDTLSVYGAVTQQWYLNGSAINNATSNIYIATQGGSYTVAVTDTNGCLATSSAVIISGIDNVSEEDVVSVYPNPLTVGGWQLTVGNNFIGSEAEVFDAEGRTVWKSEIRNQKSEISPALSRGVYLLRISSSKNSVVRKLIRL